MLQKGLCLILYKFMLTQISVLPSSNLVLEIQQCFVSLYLQLFNILTPIDGIGGISGGDIFIGIMNLIMRCEDM